MLNATNPKNNNATTTAMRAPMMAPPNITPIKAVPMTRRKIRMPSSGSVGGTISCACKAKGSRKHKNVPIVRNFCMDNKLKLNVQSAVL
jgi:hypothetical protein